MPGFPIITTTGDLLIGGIAGIETRLPGNTTEDRQFLVSVGDGGDAAAPEWTSITMTDVDGLSTALSGKASTTHSHAISDVTNLQTALDSKASLIGASFTGPVQLPAGSAAAPAIVLASSFLTGIYNVNDSIGFVANGYEKWRVGGAGALACVNGTRVLSGSTGYSFTADDNTGITNPSADTLAFLTGGTERMRISAGGVISLTGALSVASMADSAAPNNSIYYSTTASKLAYKDSGGSVHALY